MAYILVSLQNIINRRYNKCNIGLFIFVMLIVYKNLLLSMSIAYRNICNFCSNITADKN